VTGHVFISYSHQDRPYAESLSAHLRAAGLNPWTDNGIEHGARWKQTIEERINTCVAFVPVMSENSRAAAWVAREIDLAQELLKPILPIRLSGRRFIELRDIQSEDVVDGGLPGPDFVAQLRAITAAASNGPQDELAELVRRHDEAYQLGQAGDRAQAARLFRSLVADTTRVLGPEHRHTLASRHEYARNIGDTGDRAESIRLLRALVTDSTSLLGADAPATLKSRHVLARNLGATGDHAEAIAMLRGLVADRTRVLGPDHPATLKSRQQLAWNLAEAGDVEAARGEFRSLVADRTRVLGADHPETRLSYDWLRHLGG
jgi:hypothetical protein